MTPPTSRFHQVERYETTRVLLACKHRDGNYVCAHILKMKSYIEKLKRVGIVFPKEQAINLVLLLFPKSYGYFIENFHMRNLDVTLNDLAESLITIEVEMLSKIKA